MIILVLVLLKLCLTYVIISHQNSTVEDLRLSTPFVFMKTYRNASIYKLLLFCFSNVFFLHHPCGIPQIMHEIFNNEQGIHGCGWFKIDKIRFVCLYGR